MSNDYTYRYLVVVGYQELDVEADDCRRLTVDEVLAQAKSEYSSVDFTDKSVQIYEESTYAECIYSNDLVDDFDVPTLEASLGTVEEYSLDISSHRPPFIQLLAPNGVRYMIVAGTWGFENGVSDNAKSDPKTILEIQNYLRKRLQLAY